MDIMESYKQCKEPLLTEEIINEDELKAGDIVYTNKKEIDYVKDVLNDKEVKLKSGAVVKKEKLVKFNKDNYFHASAMRALKKD